MPAIRVQRILQKAGLTSRRGAEDWIQAGRVTVNGQVVELGATADPDKDQIAVDGRPVKISDTPPAYLALYKPPGYTTSLRDRHAAHLISELIPPKFGRLFPVGRLDRDSEGIILLTNDGDLAQALMHPSHGVQKVYEVWVRGVPKKTHMERMRHGIQLEDGPAQPDRVDVVKRESDRTLMRVVLHEGRKREIRRIFDSIGHPVEQLVRTRYGNITIEGLEPGRPRPLTHREVRELKALTESERAGKEHGSIGGKTQERRARYSRGGGISPSRSRNTVGHARRDSRRPHR